MIDVLRYSAFTTTPGGGNPAGVVVDARGLDDATMQAVASQVGYSETAFLAPVGQSGREFDVRYFAPSIEVPFCGHATIATAVVLGERLGVGPLLFHTRAGDVAVEVEAQGANLRATLTSVEPDLVEITNAELDALLEALRWSRDEIDPAFEPRVSFAGAWHPIIAARTRACLSDLDYDFEALRDLMIEKSWTTIQLVWRESPTVFHARNPFPVGGVVEDPATGAGAAALGHYLRATGLIGAPATVTIHQGVDMGRPSLLTVDVDDVEPRIRVSGTAVPIPGGT